MEAGPRSGFPASVNTSKRTSGSSGEEPIPRKPRWEEDMSALGTAVWCGYKLITASLH